jgi:hypothetical protein
MEVYTELFRLPRFQRDLTKTLMSLLKKAVLPRSTRSTQRINKEKLRALRDLCGEFLPFPVKNGRTIISLEAHLKRIIRYLETREQPTG